MKTCKPTLAQAALNASCARILQKVLGRGVRDPLRKVLILDELVATELLVEQQIDKN